MEHIMPLLSVALKAAVAAGKEITEVYELPVAVEYKEDNSPLTEADQRSHVMIMTMLEASGLPVLSEEGRSIPFAERTRWKRFWLVDPLDGTKEFIKRNGEFTVNIALIENGKSIAGVVYAPVINMLYFGAVGIGSYRLEADEEYLSHLMQSHHTADRMIEAGTRLPMQQEEHTFTAVASRSHLTPETATFIENLQAEHGTIKMVSKGSSLKLCLVAEGSADVYPRFAPTMEWDTAAGQAVAVAAGCSVINGHTMSDTLVYNKEDLLNPWFVVQRD